MPPKVDKAAQQAMAKKIEDKTFGMKNKNKSKAVQQQIHQMKSSAGLNQDKNKVRRSTKPGAGLALTPLTGDRASAAG
jgi:hypothetical protein